MDTSSTLISRTLKVTTSEIPELIDVCLRSQNNLLIVGDPGTGKSTIIKNMAEQGYKVTMLTGSSTYEETVNGIPYMDASKKSSTGNNLSVYNVPSWLEDVAKHQDKQILFIDEFNTADGQVLKTFLSILTERKVPTQPETLAIPENCVIVAAMNPSDQNDGEQLIRPLKSRFMTVQIMSTVDDYRNFIMANNNFDSIPEDKLGGIIDQVTEDNWCKEHAYNEVNPRSFTNFLRTLNGEIKNGADADKTCKKYSTAFLGVELSYPTDEVIELQKEQKRMARNEYPTREDMEAMDDDALNDLYTKMSSKMNSRADKVCLIIKDILANRKA